MDILAHGLWTAAALTVASRHTTITPAAARVTVAAAIAPDIVHALPLLLWSVLDGQSPLQLLIAYGVAWPGQEPWLPPSVESISHHLHCLAHRAMAAGAVTLMCLCTLRKIPLLLYGWWSHIVIDVFTHSADFYPAPVLYPLSDWTFDGVAWNAPAVLLANYMVLAAAWAWVLQGRHSSAQPSGHRFD